MTITIRNLVKNGIPKQGDTFVWAGSRITLCEMEQISYRPSGSAHDGDVFDATFECHVVIDYYNPPREGVVVNLSRPHLSCQVNI